MSELKYVGDQILFQSCKYSLKQHKQYPICDYIARAEQADIQDRVGTQKTRTEKYYLGAILAQLKNGARPIQA